MRGIRFQYLIKALSGTDLIPESQAAKSDQIIAVNTVVCRQAGLKQLHVRE